MITQKLKLQKSIKAKASIVFPNSHPIEINNATVFSEKTDDEILMVVQDTANPNVQIHIKMNKVNNYL